MIDGYNSVINSSPDYIIFNYYLINEIILFILKNYFVTIFLQSIRILVLGHLLGYFYELFRCPQLCTMNLKLENFFSFFTLIFYFYI